MEGERNRFVPVSLCYGKTSSTKLSLNQPNVGFVPLRRKLVPFFPLLFPRTQVSVICIPVFNSADNIGGSL